MANILVLEDDPEFGPLLRTSLEDSGHQTTLRRDATSAQIAFEEDTFDLVIADVVVKKNDVPVPDGGILLTSRLSRLSRERGEAIPIIVMSGQTHYVGMHDILQYAITSGATEVLKKPFAPNELFEMIDRLLEKNLH